MVNTKHGLCLFGLVLVTCGVIFLIQKYKDSEPVTKVYRRQQTSLHWNAWHGEGLCVFNRDGDCTAVHLDSCPDDSCGHGISRVPCTSDNCPAIWSEWVAGSNIDNLCTLNRQRNCSIIHNVPGCTEFQTESIICPNSTWAPWSDWQCTNVDAKHCEARRTRQCKMDDQNTPCNGSISETQPCSSQRCQGQAVSFWTEWTIHRCFFEKDSCFYIRNRTCSTGDNDQCDGKHYHISANCSTNCYGNWSSWSNWTCTDQNGLYFANRSRTCSAKLDSICKGAPSESYACGPRPCSVCKEYAPLTTTAPEPNSFWTQWECFEANGLVYRIRYDSRCNDSDCQSTRKHEIDWCNIAKCPECYNDTVPMVQNTEPPTTIAATVETTTDNPLNHWECRNKSGLMFRVEYKDCTSADCKGENHELVQCNQTTCPECFPQIGQGNGGCYDELGTSCSTPELRNLICNDTDSAQRFCRLTCKLCIPPSTTSSTSTTASILHTNTPLTSPPNTGLTSSTIDKRTSLYPTNNPITSSTDYIKVSTPSSNMNLTNGPLNTNKLSTTSGSAQSTNPETTTSTSVSFNPSNVATTSPTDSLGLSSTSSTDNPTNGPLTTDKLPSSSSLTDFTSSATTSDTATTVLGTSSTTVEPITADITTQEIQSSQTPNVHETVSTTTPSSTTKALTGSASNTGAIESSTVAAGSQGTSSNSNVPDSTTSTKLSTSFTTSSAGNSSCFDKLGEDACTSFGQSFFCGDPDVAYQSCRKTCKLCEDPTCVDKLGEDACTSFGRSFYCSDPVVAFDSCRKTCNLCDSTNTTAITSTSKGSTTATAPSSNPSIAQGTSTKSTDSSSTIRSSPTKPTVDSSTIQDTSTKSTDSSSTVQRFPTTPTVDSSTDLGTSDVMSSSTVVTKDSSVTGTGTTTTSATLVTGGPSVNGTGVGQTTTANTVNNQCTDDWGSTCTSFSLAEDICADVNTAPRCRKTCKLCVPPTDTVTNSEITGTSSTITTDTSFKDPPTSSQGVTATTYPTNTGFTARTNDIGIISNTTISSENPSTTSGSIPSSSFPSSGLTDSISNTKSSTSSSAYTSIAGANNSSKPDSTTTSTHPASGASNGMAGTDIITSGYTSTPTGIVTSGASSMAGTNNSTGGNGSTTPGNAASSASPVHNSTSISSATSTSSQLTMPSTTVQVTTPAHIQTTAGQTGHTIAPVPTKCAACFGPPELCDELYEIQTCPAPNNYCINQVKNHADGSRSIQRGCGNHTTCYREWFQGSSDNDKCQNFVEDSVITLEFECTYCCIRGTFN